MPDVGEVVGVSVRIDDYDELIAADKANKLDPTPYYWYTDQRKYGSAHTGGPASGRRALSCGSRAMTTSVTLPFPALHRLLRAVIIVSLENENTSHSALLTPAQR